MYPVLPVNYYEYCAYLNFINQASMMPHPVPVGSNPRLLTWNGPNPREVLNSANQKNCFKNKKWSVPKGKHFKSRSFPNPCLTSQVPVANQVNSLKLNSKSLFLDLNLLNETINPKDAASNSAFSFCCNGKEIPVKLKKIVIRLKHLLNRQNIILSEFNLIGGALQQILLHKEKKRNGDIDFQGYVKGKHGKKVTTIELLKVVSQVIEEILLIPADQDNSKNKPGVSSFPDRMKRLQTKPFILKTLFYDDNFLLVTLPLQLPDPDHPSQKIPVDIDIRITIEKVVSSISSASCFEWNLLHYFGHKSPDQIPVTGSQGYEKSLQEAFDLLQQGLFFVNEESAKTTSNGLRAYATLFAKGLLPTDFQSARVYLMKWVREMDESSNGVQLAVNNYFHDLEKYALRHFWVDGNVDTFALSLYLINLRTLFSSHEWPNGWTYTQEEFLQVFDNKAFFLLHKSLPIITQDYLKTLKLILFWNAAQHSEKMLALPNSNLFAFRVPPEKFGVISEIPLKETLHFNWNEWDQQMKIMLPLLEGLGLPLSADYLKDTISKMICDPHSSFHTMLLSKNAFTEADSIRLKTLKLGLKSSFKYREFFSIFLKAIKQNPDSRKEVLQELHSFMRASYPEIEFNHFGEVIEEDIPKLFEALVMDLKGSEEGQMELCKTLLHGSCLEFREQTILLIFPHLNPRLSEKCFRQLWSAEDRKSFGISDSVFYKLLNMALNSPTHLKAWDKVFKQKLPFVLDEAQADVFPAELANVIGAFFKIEQSIYHGSLVNMLLNLSRLGYPKEKIKYSLESCLQQYLKNNPVGFKAIFDSGIFTPPTMWELLAGELFNLEHSSILQTLSFQCWENNETSNPMLEKYWGNAMQQNGLPPALLDKISNIRNKSEDFQRQLDIAKIPASQLYLARLTVLTKNPKKQYMAEVSVQEQWKNIKDAFCFEHYKYDENEWIKILNLIESGLKNSAPQEFLPVLTDLLRLVPKYIQALKPYLVSLEEKCLEKVAFASLTEIWPKLHLFTQFYLHRFSIDERNRRDDKLIDTILFKIFIHSPEEEALEIFHVFVQKQTRIHPNELKKYLDTFHDIMKNNPKLYDLKKAAVLWGELVLKIETVGIKTIPHELSSKWIELLEYHFLKFENISVLPLPLNRFCHFLENARDDNNQKLYVGAIKAMVYTENLKKTLNESQQNFYPTLANEWETNWNEVMDSYMQMEDLEELYKIFVKAKGNQLFSKRKKIEHFAKFQHVFFKLAQTSVLLIKDKKFWKTNKNADVNICKNNYFKNIDFFHKNFINFYQWTATMDLELIDVNTFTQGLANHINILKDAKKILSEQHVEKIEAFERELNDFVFKNPHLYKAKGDLSLTDSIWKIQGKKTRRSMVVCSEEYSKAMNLLNQSGEKKE